MNSGVAIQQAIAALNEAKALIICAGAGMGVDSGLPDFRGKEGFWKAYPVIARFGYTFAEMANPRWFEYDPALAWAFYGHRLNLYRRTQPHPGFAHLLEIAQSKPAGYFVFTSNVDGHFQKAGFPAERILECHGSILHAQCSKPCGLALWEIGSEDLAVDEVRFRAREPLPRCQFCQRVARPNILMFDDGQWIPYRRERQEAAMEDWMQHLARRNVKPVIVEIGAGTEVPTVRLTSERFASRFSATLIRINLQEPQVPGKNISLAMGGQEAIQLLHEQAKMLRF